MPLSKFFGELPVFALKRTAFCRESKEKRSASNFGNLNYRGFDPHL